MSTPRIKAHERMRANAAPSPNGRGPRKPPPQPEPGEPPPPPRKLELIPADTVMMEPNRWVVPDVIIRGGLTVIGGDGGYGKSSLTVHLAAMLSQGEACFGLEYERLLPSRTLLVGCEDSWASTVVPRLAAAGADLGNVFFVGDMKREGDDDASFTLSAAGLESLENAIRELGDVACIVIDPVSAFLPSDIDDHKDANVRRMLRPLDELAKRLDIAIVLIKHLNKSDSGNSGNLFSGSRAYLNAARAAFFVGPDPTDDDGERRVFVPEKKNLSPKSKGIAFRAVPLDEAEAERVLRMPQAAKLSEEDRAALREQLFCLEWLGATDVSARDLAKARSGKDDTGARGLRVASCGEWLKSYLAGGCVPADEVASAAKAAGFSRNILFAAKKDNPSVRASNKGQFRGQWHWWIEVPGQSVPAECPD